MRRQVAIGCVSLGIAMVTVLAIATIAAPIADPVEPEPLTPEDEERRISFEGYESGVWPYLSKEQSFRRTSPINVVVRGETGDVMRILRERGQGDWEEVPPEEQGAAPGEHTPGGGMTNASADGVAIDWETTDGATRYAYVDDGDGGEWIDETAQLHDGDYYGHRYHIRLYESPTGSEPWVAMQAHSEHFDWFTLRHAVHGTEDSQDRVEAAFVDAPPTDDLWRGYVANDDSSDSDGWASMIELALLASLFTTSTISLGWLRRWWRRYRSERNRSRAIRAAAGQQSGSEAGTQSGSGAGTQSGSGAGTPTSASGANSPIDTFLQRHLTPVDRRRLRAARDRVSLRKVLLAGTIVGILLGVRLAGIVLERHADFLTMHQIAAVLYPFIAVGIPVATYFLAAGIERRMDAAMTASVGMAAGVLLDYAYVGLDVIPIVVLLQRLAVIFALGLIAGGAARRAARENRLNGLVTAGVVLWVVLLAATLLGRI